MLIRHLAIAPNEGSHRNGFRSEGKEGILVDFGMYCWVQKVQLQYSDHNWIMKREGKEDRGFSNGKYKIRAELEPGVAESRKVNEFIYYFTYCEAKKGKDNSSRYDKGYLCLIHHISTNSLTLFFKKSKKIADMNSQQNDMINLHGYSFSSLRQLFSNKFLIQYQIKDNTFHMQVKLQTEEVANKWRQFICKCKPEAVHFSKNGRNMILEEEKQTDALLSTKESKTSVEDQRKLAKILDYRASSQKMDHKKCQFCLIDSDSTQLQYKMDKLQELLKIQKNKTKECSLQFQQNKRRYLQQYEALLQEKRTIQQRLTICQAELRRLKQKRKATQRKATLQTTISLEQHQQLKTNVSILSDKNKQLQSKLHQLQKQSEENQRKIRFNEQQKKILNHKLKEALKQNQQSNARNKDMTKKFQEKCDIYEYDKETLKKTDQSLLHSNESLKKEVKALQAQIAAQKNAVDHAERIQKIKQDYQTQQKSLKLNYEMKLAQITQQCQTNVSILSDKNKQLQNKLHQLQKQSEENQRKIGFNEQQKKILNHKLKEALKQNQQSNARNKDMTKKFHEKCDIYEYDKETLKKTNQSLLHSNESLKKEVKALQAQIAAQKSAVDHAERIQKIKQDYQTQQKSLKLNYEMKLAQITQQCQLLKQEVMMSKASSEQSGKLIKTIIFNGVFNGGILDNCDSYKEYMITEIQSYMNRSIFKTKLIYRFEPLNKVNFHNYIDSCSNLVLIARTSSGFYLAAFTESPFFPKGNVNDAGLLLSLTNCITFRCLEGKKAVTYDEYYIIFGNSELRIKSNQNRIFSNFGISNGFYNSNGLKVDTLFGENEREVDLDAYEIYQVHFG